MGMTLSTLVPINPSTGGGGGGGGVPDDGSVTTPKLADNAVTSLKIADGAIVNADVSASAGIATTKLAPDPLARANHTGTQLAATISDFHPAVRLNRLDQMATPTASVALGGQTITGLGTPTNPTDAVTKAYADTAGGGISANLYDAFTILRADVDNTPTALTIPASTFVGRAASGGIAALTGAQAKIILGITSADVSDFTAAVQAVPGVGLADGSVTSAKIADGTIVDADIAANAGIALSKLAVDPRDRATHTGVQLAATVSDFHTAVRTNRLDQMAKPTAAVDFNGQVGIGLGAPVNAGDVVNKAYADNVAAGLDFKASVRAASTATVTLASPGAAIDGVTLTSGDRVLLKNQTTSTENGIYNWNGAASALTRASDADASAEVTSGMYVFVEGGTTNGAKAFVLLTLDPITLGSTGLTFGLFSGGGASIVGTANRITVTGTQVDISPTYVGQASITTVGLVRTGSWVGTTAALTNCVVGYDAGTGLTSGNNNTFTGYQAGTNSGSSVWNTCLGSQTAGAGNFLNGGYNTCLGGQAGYGLNNGANNVFLGYQAGKSSVDAGQNIYIGHSAGLNATSSNNVFIGLSAGSGVTSAVGNTLIGNNTGRFLGATPAGDNNTLIGSNVGGSYLYDNTMIGAGAGTSNVNGFANTFLGRSAGATANAAAGCVCVGWSADVTGTATFATVVGRLASSANASGATAIGTASQANGNYASALGWGAQANAAGAVAIGTNSSGTGAQTAVANEIKLGTTAHTVNIPGPVSVGANPASGGQIRLPNGAMISARNTANTGDIGVITIVGNGIQLGGSLGFFGHTPAALDTGWTVGSYTPKRTGLSSGLTLADCANILSTLVTVLQGYGMLA